ncbi:hypothetical protein GQ43DRAFT_441937 [Delitschia confertaspora ATCC 74209]|uniref:Peptidase S54 rhomboid domain-containing protein n=1 Tax=Delitschia confertaspora ATCC 74209 TaxID=1513339 RepID=A0A9P4MRK9_9PLEO|nr:hypothetical protein GQ43DRAFT_441937 [Delitschia confertaspora ATCC 74209]
MSNVLLPVALLRPSCLLAVRPGSVSVTQQWNAVSIAFGRHFSSQKPYLRPYLRLRPILQLYNSSLPQFHLRSFSTTLHPRASVNKSSQITLPSAPELPKKKRQVRIGPLPCGEVSPKTIESIFGRRISPADGNGVLRILHHRRISGSLADYGVDNLSNKFRGLTPELATRGLEWLRNAFPVDEARAAEEWAEREANRISYELWLQEEEGGKKEENPEAAWQQIQEEKKRVYHTGMLHHGPSVLEQSIQEKRKKRLEAAAKRAEEKEARKAKERELIASGQYVRSPGGTALVKPGQTTYVDVFGREQVDERKKWTEHFAKMSETPFKSEEEMLKSKTIFQRLYPMTVFGIIVFGLSYAFATTYTPPLESYRLLRDISPALATTGTILFLNALVLLAWRRKPWWPTMTKYFMNVPGYPRPAQAVLNTFSHIKFDHFFANMLWLMTVGVLCHDLVGRGTFVGAYVASGIMGSLATLYSANLGLIPISIHTLGASAAMYGITTLFLLVTQQQSIKIPFLKDAEVGFWPKALWVVILGMEVRGAMRGKGKLDHASHLGGILAGGIIAGWMRWREGNGGEKIGGEQKGSPVDVVGLFKEEAEGVKNVFKDIKGDGERK